MRWIDAAETMINAGEGWAELGFRGQFVPRELMSAAQIAAALPYDPPPPPPLTVTPWQARTALAQQGLLDDIEALIDSLGPSNPAHIAWHYAERIRRDSPLIAALQSQIGLTDAQLDDLFALAKSLSL